MCLRRTDLVLGGAGARPFFFSKLGPAAGRPTRREGPSFIPATCTNTNRTSTMPRSTNHDESDDEDYERDEARAEAATGGERRRGRDKKSKKRSGAPTDADAADPEGGVNDTGGGGGGGGGKKKKKRSKKVKVMEESGQTDEERRALRRAQRKLQHKIVHSEQGAELEDPNADAFEQIRGENNTLFEDVKFTREAVLDGDNLELISRRAARQVDKLVQVSGATVLLMGIPQHWVFVRSTHTLLHITSYMHQCNAPIYPSLQVPRYDSGRFIQKLRSKLTAKAGSTTYFDWRTLGREAGVCFNSVPSRIAFLNGPVDVIYVPKERKKREKRVVEEEEEDEEEEQPEELNQKDKAKDGDKLSAVERNIQTVNKVLNKKSQEAYDRNATAYQEEKDTLDDDEKKRKKKRLKTQGFEIDAVQHLFNPKSFTQTVENIFHFSFLVKKGSAGIAVRNEKESKEWGGTGVGPVVRAVDGKLQAHPSTAKQAIVSLNMQDWRDMCQAFEVTKGDIPHRKGSKHSRK